MTSDTSDMAKEKKSEKIKEPPSDSEEEKGSRMTCHEIIVISTLLFVTGTGALCYSLIGPFFSNEAALKGTSQTVTGFIFGIYDVIIFIFSPIVGLMITKVAPKYLFVSGILICSICTTVFGCLDMVPGGSVFVALCFIFRILGASGAAMYTTASFTIAASSYPERISTYFGALESSTALGLMTGPVIGGGLYAAGGYKLPFLVTGGLLLICFVISIFAIPKTDDLPDEYVKKTKKTDAFSICRLLSKPLVIAAYSATVLGAICISFITPVLAGFLKQFNLAPYYVGVFFAVGPVVYGTCSPIVGLVIDKWHYGKIFIVAGLILIGSSELMYGPSPLFNGSPSLWLCGISPAVMGVGVALVWVPSFSEILTDARRIGFPDNLQTYGIVSGLINSSFSLGGFLGPLMSGALTEAVGFRWATTAIAFPNFLLAIILAIVFVIVKFHRRIYMKKGGIPNGELLNESSAILTDKKQTYATH